MAARKSESTEMRPSTQPGKTYESVSVNFEPSTEDIKDIQELSKYTNPLATRNLHTDGPDWLLDSTLGRWLGSKRLCFTNRTLLQVLLWLVLLGLFTEIDFGLPFFLISLFYWLYKGLRSPAARQPGEMSAYSVFNPDCQPILGTLSAEQLEKELFLYSL